LLYTEYRGKVFKVVLVLVIVSSYSIFIKEGNLCFDHVISIVMKCLKIIEYKYMLSDFNAKLHILIVFLQLLAQHDLAAFDKLTSSYSMFIKEDELCFHYLRSIVIMEGLRIME
jgi:hypothetical protein